MTVGNTGVALARQAMEALQRLDAEGRTLRPDGVDHFTWSADVMDELARLAELLGRTIERVSGEEAFGAESHAQALATAIVAHRNSLLRHGRGERPFPDGGDPQLPRAIVEGIHGGITPLAVVGDKARYGVNRNAGTTTRP
ncbi:hypothetical protein PHK61_08555 [Actinomycetospora lutea]|uniref:hypothetical protein n=1 Tax=Actinomycetospora lutea TaxID=663604 RepID=UPI0023660177|nr:hypothetical protein [Actinomycetospora lutea]MDD7938466.1 hypothetical protein [Actinomycetospora lutea]